MTEITVTITVDVDSDRWMDDFGVDQRSLAQDVEDYLMFDVLGHDPAFEQGYMRPLRWRAQLVVRDLPDDTPANLDECTCLYECRQCDLSGTWHAHDYACPAHQTSLIGQANSRVP